MSKYKKLIFVCILTISLFVVTGCNFNKLSCMITGHHEFGPIYDEGYLCEQDIKIRNECKSCGEILHQDILKKVHHKFANGICEICHREKIAIYFNIYEENGIEYVNYGKYPQTVVVDAELINRLNQIKYLNQNGWVELDGVEYAKMIAYPRSEDYRFSDGTKVERHKTYYFKLEPIKWRILFKHEVVEGEVAELTLLSEKILYSDCFSPTNVYRTVYGENIMPNNYEFSVVRAWLNGLNGSEYGAGNHRNGGFVNLAFSQEEKKSLVTSSTGLGYDLVWLLSEEDVTEVNYGFPNHTSSSVIREAEPTDFAIADYTLVSANGKSTWMLCTPGASNHRNVMMVSNTGEVYEEWISLTTLEYFGVRPSITIFIQALEYK